MDQKTFTELLARYRVVRPRDAELPRPRRGGRGGSSGRPTATAAALPAAAAAASVAAPIAAPDFWAGLTPFLEKHYGAAGAKAVSAAFDTLHYASLRALNYEDCEDLCAMLASELGLDPATGGGGLPGDAAKGV